jgi:ribosome-associated translation inhibitor RaiA
MKPGHMNYEFHGMSPSDWTENFLNEEFAPLMNHSPKDSSLKLRVEMFDDGVEGKLLMHSPAGTFVVEHKESDMNTLVKSLKKKMKAQLHKWKESGHHFHTGTKAV